MFDIEIQTSGYRNLPLRARFYQGAIDASTTMTRAKFSTLKESYILFICKGDPFGCNIPVYTVKQTFYEKPKLLYDDRTPNGRMSICTSVMFWKKKKIKSGKSHVKKEQTLLKHKKALALRASAFFVKV